MSDRVIFLIAPNVSEQMGGEAIKALQVFREFKKLNRNTFQITHERCRSEICGRLRLNDVIFVPDTIVSKIIWHSRVLRPLIDIWFSWNAIRLAEKNAISLGKADRSTVIHQTEPNSPVLIRSLSKLCLNVIGPMNGNIYYPRVFRRHESWTKKVRRKLHMPIQKCSAVIFRKQKEADVILCAGGGRTLESLWAAGYRRDIVVETVDSGIEDKILDRPRIAHKGENFHFVHYGRLVFHKGIFLAIEAIKQADERTRLDIIGMGPERESCQRLVRSLDLESRVKFLGWYESHGELLDGLSRYRGMLFPSLEDANGIVVQEALAIGLPPICLDWGGPQLLVEDGKSGFLIKPTTKHGIVNEIAKAVDKLSKEPGFAEQMSIEGRSRAEAWRWSRVAKEWMSAYPNSQKLAVEGERHLRDPRGLRLRPRKDLF